MRARRPCEVDRPGNAASGTTAFVRRERRLRAVRYRLALPCAYEGCEARAAPGVKYCWEHLDLTWGKMRADGYLEPAPAGPKA